MKFTALPVKEGDSFLLQVDDKNILVDTGKDLNECNVLIQGITNTLDVVIITHYDSDHVNGLLALLNSSVVIKQVWLPEIFGKIEKTLHERKNNLLKSIVFSDNSNIQGEIALWLNEPEKIILYDFTDQEFDQANDTGENRYKKNIKWHSELIRKGDYFFEREDETIGFSILKFSKRIFNVLYIKKKHIKTIDEIVSKCKEKNIKVRWLKYNKEYNPIQVDKSIELFALNSQENLNIKAFIDDNDIILQLTPINRESLVFKFETDGKPNVLFSADSGFEFLSKKKLIGLQDNSIVTAAHHGSKDNLNVKTYKLVDGKDLIYIRSDNQNKVRPCDDYIKLNKKYCTVCNTATPPQNKKVELEFINGAWLTNNNECKCV
jgi:ribonuclease BN (tRNA processing enzyme)